MPVSEWSRHRSLIGAAWLAFALGLTVLMFSSPAGKATLLVNLVWASFALVHGLCVWSLPVAGGAYTAIAAMSGVALLRDAPVEDATWEERLEVAVIAVLAAVLIWHVRRAAEAYRRLHRYSREELERARSRELASRLGSHELRTRLTIARGFVDQIQSFSRDTQSRLDAAVALSEVDKATATSTNLLRLVSFDAPPERSPVDVAALIAHMGRRWTFREDRRWSFVAEPAGVIGDASRLEAAIDALVENAVKFTDDGDSICVAARNDGDAIEISVRDSGIGIPVVDLERVTGLFETSKAPDPRAGSGLGLSIARAVAEACGGSLSIDSMDGEFTEVRMRLPYVPVDVVARPIPIDSRHRTLRLRVTPSARPPGVA